MDPTKKELYVQKRASGVDVSDPNIASTWELVRSDVDSKNWMLLSVVNNIAVLQSHGSTFVELLSSLVDTDILLGVFKAQVKGMSKFFHVYFVGMTICIYDAFDGFIN